MTMALGSTLAVAPGDFMALWAGVLITLVAALIATVRETLAIYSRKGLLDRIPTEKRERYLGYLDLDDEYQAALRSVDLGLRMALAACAVFALYNPAIVDTVGSGGRAAMLVTAGLVGTVVIFLELLPSVLARRSPERLLIYLLPGVHRFYRVIEYPLRAFQWSVSIGARVLGSPPERGAAELAEEEILSAAEEGQREGILERSEISMIEAIIEFHDREVSEVLTPRTGMVAIEVGSSIEDCVRLATECGHSRIPVYEGSRDHIVGILYVKDLLQFVHRSSEEKTGIRSLLRKPHFVPESKKVSELLQEFKTQRFHIAIVLDEFAGTEGLVTIEDIVEEILGEIEQESGPDSRQPRFERVGDGAIEVGARMTIYELQRELKTEFDGQFPVDIPEDDSFDTVGGFIASSLERIPAAGETLKRGDTLFEVLDADKRGIKRVRIRLLRAGASVNDE